MLETWNWAAGYWWDWMAPMFWQVSLVVFAVSCLDLWLRRWAWPQLRLALWMLVLLKLVLPPSLASPMGFSIGSLPPSILEAAVFQASRQAAASAAGSEFPIAGLAMAVWLAGVIVLGGMLSAGWRRAKRRLLDGSGLPPSRQVLELVEETARSLGLRRVPGVILSSQVASPAVLGLRRPIILLPLLQEDPGGLRSLRHGLVHEMAHIGRGDLWIQALSQFLLILYWFQPLLFVARRRIAVLRELSCDAEVVRHFPQEVREYRATLLACARRLIEGPVGGPGILGLGRANIVGRLRWLEKPVLGPRFRMLWTWSLVLPLFGVLLLQGDTTPPVARSDPFEEMAWRNLRQAAQGVNPGTFRLRYSALYLQSLEKERAAGID